MKRIKIVSFVLIIATMITGINRMTIQAASLKLNKTKITIEEGKTKQLKVKGAKSGKVKWSSKKKKIAKVSSKGLVKGVKAGSTKVIAKYGKKKLTCKVIVKTKKNKSTVTPPPVVTVPNNTPAPVAPIVTPAPLKVLSGFDAVVKCVKDKGTVNAEGNPCLSYAYNVNNTEGLIVLNLEISYSQVDDQLTCSSIGTFDDGEQQRFKMLVKRNSTAYNNQFTFVYLDNEFVLDSTIIPQTYKASVNPLFTISKCTGPLINETEVWSYIENGTINKFIDLSLLGWNLYLLVPSKVTIESLGFVYVNLK